MRERIELEVWRPNFSFDFGIYYLCDFGQIIDCLTKPDFFLICYVRILHWLITLIPVFSNIEP